MSKASWKKVGSQWRQVSPLEVSVFCDAAPIPIATGNSGEGILCVDDIGSSLSAKSEILDNKAGGLF